VALCGRWGKLSGERSVQNSGATFEAFMSTLEGIDEFVLVIREVY